MKERDGGSSHEGDFKHYPKSPAKRRPPTHVGGATRWNAIDMLAVTQCLRMLLGMRVTKFILSSLHDDWRKAWKTAHEITRSEITTEEKDGAVKWIQWMPHGLLHAPIMRG